MGHQGALGSPRAVGAAAALIALALAGPWVASPAGAREISEQLILQPNSYYYIVLLRFPAGNGSDLAVHWSAERPVDVWVMSLKSFDDYEANRGVTFELEWSGTSGAVEYNISAAREAEQPFYFVIDNTARGKLSPPAGDPTAAKVSLEGSTRMPGYSSGQATRDPGYESAMQWALIAALLVPVALLALFLVVRQRKKTRLSKIGQQVGLTPAPAAAPVNFCGFCGKPLRAGSAFCTECGKPV